MSADGRAAVPLVEMEGAVVFTMALGIAVDDTLHLILRMREEQQRGRGPHEALHTAVLRSGRVVLITSVLLMSGFGLNLLSSFSATRLLGTLGVTIIATALLCDVLLLPALIVRFGSRR